ncbi:acetylxylan esterase [Oryzibacter oryziterrae]|uniref:acetylxylan esterase n=1 Tax=Oryzibacter oryziterrae TaxID=2766474 RepID=UPI001F48A3A9|nr:acetylxylan esterase [Oryzibacter oryziterrae]
MTFPHNFPFDPAYGLTLDDLQAVAPPEEPEDFDAFWRARYAAALAVDPAPKLKVGKIQHPNWHVVSLTYRSTGKFKIKGWLLLPKSGPVRRGLVVGHGYGGRDQPDLDLPVEETAILFPCFRGLSRSARAPISTQSNWHVLHDIDKPAEYIIGGCVADLWLAVSTLIALYPWLDGNIGYAGISFGGGIGALAIPYDRRIDRGHLALPTFGAQELRLKLPSVGSAASVQAYEREHGNAMQTLRLYDAAVAARRIAVPMLMAVALFDPAVAPPCQFAVANAVTRNLCKTVILDAGHFDYPGKQEQDAMLRCEFARFFAPHEARISSLA